MREKNNKYKKVYNNYQFYENAALAKYIEKKSSEGYRLCSMRGKTCELLTFSRIKSKAPNSYSIYRKHLDKQVDAEIDKMKAEKDEIIYQNNYYIVFGRKADKDIEKKQNILLGIRIKKAAALISTFQILSIVSFVLKILLMENGNIYLNRLYLLLFLALITNFLCYFAGDIHDIIAGKGIKAEGILYFSERTKWKEMLFHIGDILKWLILLGSICATVAMLLITKDSVIAINLLKMWLIYGLVGCVYRLRYGNSYMKLLIIEVFMATLSFL